MPARRGRPRDTNLDELILTTTERLLAEGHYFSLTLDEIATEIGTTKAAIYRRFRSKKDLALAAVDALRSARWPPPSTSDLRSDLVWQLNDLRTVASRFSGMSLTGLVLADQGEWLRLFRQRVVHTRREAIRQRFERAIAAGDIRPDADVPASITLLLGYWYASCLEGAELDDNWAPRAVDVLLNYLRP